MTRLVPNIIIGFNNNNIISTGKNSNVLLIINTSGTTGITGTTGSTGCSIQVQPGSEVVCADESIMTSDPNTGCVNCPNGLLPGSIIFCPGNGGPATVDENGRFTCGSGFNQVVTIEFLPNKNSIFYGSNNIIGIVIDDPNGVQVSDERVNSNPKVLTFSNKANFRFSFYNPEFLASQDTVMIYDDQQPILIPSFYSDRYQASVTIPPDGKAQIFIRGQPSGSQ